MNEYGKEWNYPIENQHLAGNPKIFGRDIDLIRRMAYEAMYSTGITIEYYRCVEDRPDFYQDPECKWDSPIKLSAIFEDNPKIKILKDLGWYIEDEEIRPMIIYLPMYRDWTSKEVLNIKENSLIKVHYFGQSSPSEFRITDKKMDSVYGCYWVCKLAPERLEDFYEVISDGTHYLKKKQYIDDECEHSKNNTGEDEREYQHKDYEDYIKIDTEDEDDYSSMIMND